MNTLPSNGLADISGSCEDDQLSYSVGKREDGLWDLGLTVVNTDRTLTTGHYDFTAQDDGCNNYPAGSPEEYETLSPPDGKASVTGVFHSSV